jgi:hypothetical protein
MSYKKYDRNYVVTLSEQSKKWLEEHRKKNPGRSRRIEQSGDKFFRKVRRMRSLDHLNNKRRDYLL